MKLKSFVILAGLSLSLTVGCGNGAFLSQLTSPPNSPATPANSPTQSPIAATTGSPLGTQSPSQISLQPDFDRGLIFTDDKGVAIGGTDPVAYFTQGQPVAGNAAFAYEWQGAIWQFATAEHRDRFVANPEQYAPQYGGYCAYAVANNYTAPTIPAAWSVVDGKLYLNYNLSVRDRWQRDIPGNIAKANSYWPNALTDFR